jgi:hypothetical protein
VRWVFRFQPDSILCTRVFDLCMLSSDLRNTRLAPRLPGRLNCASGSVSVERGCSYITTSDQLAAANAFDACLGGSWSAYRSEHRLS